MDKKYTAKEAAVAVLKKTEELLKAWHNKMAMAETPKTTVQANEFKGIPQQKAPSAGASPKPPKPLKMFMAKKEAKRASK